MKRTVMVIQNTFAVVRACEQAWKGAFQNSIHKLFKGLLCYDPEFRSKIC